MRTTRVGCSRCPNQVTHGLYVLLLAPVGLLDGDSPALASWCVRTMLRCIGCHTQSGAALGVHAAELMVWLPEYKLALPW